VAACVVFENNPSLWRGLVLFEPVHYPKIPEESKNYPSVFISMGLADRYNRGGTGPGEGEKFLQEACRHLVPVRIDYQPGDHGYQPEQLRRAYLSLTKFILTDY